MYVEFEFELIAEDGELKEVVVIGFDSSQLIKLVEVDHKSIPGHLVDGLIVADWIIVLGDDAGVRPKRNF